MTSETQMVCRHCGSSSVAADAFARWDADCQEWQVSAVYDKGASCDVCGGETRIDEMPLVEWLRSLPKHFIFKGFSIQAFKTPDGDYGATIRDEAGRIVRNVYHDPDWDGVLGDYEEARDAARKAVLRTLDGRSN